MCEKHLNVLGQKSKNSFSKKTFQYKLNSKRTLGIFTLLRKTCSILRVIKSPISKINQVNLLRRSQISQDRLGRLRKTGLDGTRYLHQARLKTRSKKLKHFQAVQFPILICFVSKQHASGPNSLQELLPPDLLRG